MHLNKLLVKRFRLVLLDDMFENQRRELLEIVLCLRVKLHKVLQ
jgi:hypothetical protein